MLISAPFSSFKNNNCTNWSECIKKDIIASVGKDMEKPEPSYMAGGLVNLYSHLGETALQFLRKVKHNFWHNRAVPLLSNYPREMKLMSTERCIWKIFIGILLRIAKKWKQWKCPETGKWINKMWHILLIQHYSAIKWNEVQTQAATWMNFTDVLLSKSNQAERLCIRPLCLYEMFRKQHIRGDRN